MKWTRFWLPALLVAAALLLASCGNAGSTGTGADDGDHGMKGMDHGDSGGGETSRQKTTGADMTGMDHSNMGHGSMNLDAMAREMVMEDGRYSDRAFIDAMVPHHQGAIAMAEVALNNAEHEEIKELSRNIISTQQAEIEELKSIKEEEFGTPNVPMEMSQEQMRGMGIMMNPQKLAEEKPFDRAFIDAMIPHHQSAIEMAEVAREKSEIPEIEELAEGIISAQQTEIEQMTRWRQQWYPEG